MTPPQSLDDPESADDSSGTDRCTLLDEYWDGLPHESDADLRQRLVGGDPSSDPIAGDLDFLNRLHQFRKVLLAGDEASQLLSAAYKSPSS